MLGGKPPLGVTPKDIWEYNRMLDIARAIYEYINYGDLEPVKEWINELSELVTKEGD